MGLMVGAFFPVLTFTVDSTTGRPKSFAIRATATMFATRERRSRDWIDETCIGW